MELLFANPNDITVRSLDESQLEVRQNRFIEHNGRLTIYVRSLSPSSFKSVKLEVENVMTGQREHVTVSYDKDRLAPARKTPSDFSKDGGAAKSGSGRLNGYQAIALIIMFLIIVVLICLCTGCNSQNRSPYFMVREAVRL